MNFVEVKCQEEICPYHKRKNERCCFGEIDMNGRDEPVIERHKCERAKRNGPLQYVIVKIPTNIT